MSENETSLPTDASCTEEETADPGTEVPGVDTEELERKRSIRQHQILYPRQSLLLVIIIILIYIYLMK